MLVAAVVAAVRQHVQRKHSLCTVDKERASSGRLVAPARQQTGAHVCMYVV